LFNLATADFTSMARKQIKAFANAQSEAVDNLQETNHQWLDRI
jgi:hypothetical protein